MEVPIWVVYLAIPLGSALMCARFLQVAWQFVRGGKLPTHGPAHVDGLDDEAVESKP
jgi:C4-dicarboxylate transporter DctQ subunit